MPQARADGVNLHYEVVGEGEPLVLVHGSWNDHQSWQPAIEADLRASFTVVTYDRRGHGRSGNVAGQGTRRQDEDDLAALIELLGHAPAHVAGNSFGASIVLGLAARRPELFRSITVHEPPLVGVVADDPSSLAQLRPTMASIYSAMDHLRKAENEQGARLFVEEVALGPGTWEQLPAPLRERFVTYAQTWLDEQTDPAWAVLDLDRLSACTMPVLLSRGSASPTWFSTVLERLATAMPQAQRQTFEGAGHIPHMTHPQEYTTALTRFIRAAGADEPRPGQ
ncbi:alpha/beta fold hydrolase [Streptomyces xantholiticus]|uniref:alpha/beta fold hydrolase n=1 Tax=Streptomyces xantholiticus TaxID=68285 RepID=UPI001679C89B|nr:alpha/beta hydrolase [Streptomyces xantholiticus]GGW62162.1 alpha/beta hydrolase [Streptomyces xantholiticus]